MSEKISGFVLLIIGLGVMLFAVFNIYQTFTGQSEPIQLFDLKEGIGLDFSSFLVGDASPEELEQIKSENNLKSELVSPELINEPMNLFSHFLLMGFIVNVGFKIGLLGANILRPVKVDVGKNKILNAVERSETKPQQAPKI
ncbi:hypothetical protein JXA63_02940 [Candidatus Woesebacteria bacterium]|nr:hypothetical protein [Candidatus Woesebacteria bacterium]